MSGYFVDNNIKHQQHKTYQPWCNSVLSSLVRTRELYFPIPFSLEKFECDSDVLNSQEIYVLFTNGPSYKENVNLVASFGWLPLWIVIIHNEYDPNNDDDNDGSIQCRSSSRVPNDASITIRTCDDRRAPYRSDVTTRHPHGRSKE
jgi:hypothetical protein